MLNKTLLKVVQARDTVTQKIFSGHCGLKVTKVMRPFVPKGVDFVTSNELPWWEYTTTGTRKGLNRWFKSGGKIKAEKRLVKYLIASKQAIPFLRDCDNYFIQ